MSAFHLKLRAYIHIKLVITTLQSELRPIFSDLLQVFVCVNLYMSGETKVDSERQIFEKLFMTFPIYSQSFCPKSEIFVHSFLLMSDLWFEP